MKVSKVDEEYIKCALYRILNLRSNNGYSFSRVYKYPFDISNKMFVEFARDEPSYIVLDEGVSPRVLSNTYVSPVKRVRIEGYIVAYVFKEKGKDFELYYHICNE